MNRVSSPKVAEDTAGVPKLEPQQDISENIKPWWWAVIFAVAATILTFDLSLPLGVAGAVPYVALVLLGIWLPKPRHIFFLAILGSVLTFVGYVVSPSGGIAWMVLTNRGLALFAIWFAAFLISWRKTAEADLRQREAELSAVTRLSPGGIFRSDVNGVNTYVNERFLENFGLQKGDDPADWVDKLHPEDRTVSINGWQRALAAQAPCSGEFRILRPGGAVSWIQSEARPERDADGKVVGYVGFTLDITARKEAENKLKDSEERFRNFASATSDWFWEVGADGVIKFISEGFKQFSGRDPEDFVGKTFIEAAKSFEVEAEPAAWRKYASRTANQEPFPDLTFSFVDAAGNKRFMKSGGVPVLDPRSGKLVAYRGTSSDVTVQKDMELELQESEERFSLAMRGANDGLWDWNLETGQVYRSPRYSEMLGYESGEMAETREAGSVMVHPDDRPKRDEILKNCMANEMTSYEVEFRMCHKDGHYVDILSRGFAVLGDDGKVTRMVGIHSDITERKQAEVALRQAHDELEQKVEERTRDLKESEERFSLAMRGANDGLWDWNVNINEAYYSPRWWGMLGYETNELEPTWDTWERLVNPDDKDRILKEVNDCVGGKADAFDTEFRMRHKNGSWVTILSRAFLTHKDGKADRLVGTHVDITERKQLEDQVRRSQRLEAVGQLTGGVAHDFNNLLAIMIGNAELLEDLIGENEAAKKRVTAILAAIDRGSSLTQRLLAFSRQQTLSPVAKDVSNLIDGLEDMLQRTLGETVDLRIEEMPNLWPATIDSHQFENALVNLAINARDAMPEGGALTIEATNVTLDETYVAQLEDVTPGGYVKVAVSDDGSGMPPEVLEKVFEPFFTTKEVGEGSGLGLSMVYGFAKQSGGHITIHSEVDQGTTVSLYLPRSEEDVARDDIKDETTELERGSERILVVEDDEDVRNVAVNLLRHQGYEIVEAKDGAEAIKRLTEGKAFDLLFTDVVLPGGMNGVAIAEHAKRLQPNIKVIYTTGYAENAFAHAGHLDPGITVANKPYRRAELLEKVRERLDNKEA